MKLNSLLISSILLFSSATYAAEITISAPESNMPTVKESVKTILSPDEVRQLLSQNNYKLANEKLAEIGQLIKSGEIKDTGILKELEAQAQYQETLAEYTSVVKVLGSDFSSVPNLEKAKTILNAIEKNKVLALLDSTSTKLSLAKQVLKTDKDLLLKKKEIELNPSLDSKRVSNPAIPLTVDVVAVKLIEAKIHKIDILLSDLAIMNKSVTSMQKHIIATKKFYSDMKDKIEDETSKEKAEALLKVLSSIVVLGGIGFVAKTMYMRHQAMAQKRKLASEISSLAQQVQVSIDKLSVLAVDTSVIDGFRQKLKLAADKQTLLNIQKEISIILEKGNK